MNDNSSFHLSHFEFEETYSLAINFIIHKYVDLMFYDITPLFKVYAFQTFKSM